MSQPGLFLRLLLKFLKVFDVGEIDLPEPPEIKQVDDYRNAYGKQSPEEVWIDEVHLLCA